MGLHKGKDVSARTATKVWNKRVLCNKGVQHNKCAAQHKHSTTKACCSTQAQHNKRTVQQKHSAGCPFTQKCSYWESFLLAQGKFDVFNLLTERSIRGKLALDFLTTVEDGGMVATS